MKRMRILGLALVAVFALGVVAAATASAEPTWYECAKGAKGVGYEKGCTKEGGKGGYELKIGVGSKGKASKTKAIGNSTLHTYIPGKGDVPVVCADAKGSDQPVAPNLVTKAVTIFSKCKAAGAPCQSGSKKETIETVPLAGTLGYISKSPLKVGVELTSEKEPGTGYLAQFDCTGVAHVRTFGAVIGETTGDINHFSKTGDLVFTTQEKNYGFGPSVVNNPTHFEGGESEVILLTELEAEGSETFEPAGGLPSGQQGTVEVKGEEVEIKA